MSDDIVAGPDKTAGGLANFVKFLGILPGQCLSLGASILCGCFILRDPVISTNIWLMVGGTGVLAPQPLSVMLPVGIVIGYIVWFNYHFVLGPYIVWPGCQHLHFAFDQIAMKFDVDGRARSTFGYLRGLGVDWAKCRRAYLSLERHYIPSSINEQIEPIHGQIIAAQILSLFLTIHLIYRAFIQTSWNGFRAELALVCLLWLGNLIADARQHSREVDLLMSCSDDVVIGKEGPIKYLIQIGLLCDRTKISTELCNPAIILDVQAVDEYYI
jgi:hypothetical protein